MPKPKKAPEKTKLIAIELAMLVRQVRTVVVEVPETFDEEKSFADLAGATFEADDHGELYTDDGQWGCEEGTHSLIGPAAEGSKPDFLAQIDGDSIFVKEKKKRK